MLKPRIIAIAAQKGGTSKSTTSWALASILSWSYRVLAIDLDPQGIFWTSVGSVRAVTAYDTLSRGVPLQEATMPAGVGYDAKLKVVAHSPLLAGLDAETAGRFDRHFLLSDALATLSGFAYVVIDCPSSQGILTIAALCAADYCLTPSNTDDACYQQLEAMSKTMALVQSRFNPKLEWLPIVAIKNSDNCLTKPSSAR